MLCVWTFQPYRWLTCNARWSVKFRCHRIKPGHSQIAIWILYGQNDVPASGEIDGIYFPRVSQAVMAVWVVKINIARRTAAVLHIPQSPSRALYISVHIPSIAKLNHRFRGEYKIRPYGTVNFRLSFITQHTSPLFARCQVAASWRVRLPFR